MRLLGGGNEREGWWRSIGMGEREREVGWREGVGDYW